MNFTSVLYDCHLLKGVIVKRAGIIAVASGALIAGLITAGASFASAETSPPVPSVDRSISQSADYAAQVESEKAAGLVAEQKAAAAKVVADAAIAAQVAADAAAKVAADNVAAQKASDATASQSLNTSTETSITPGPVALIKCPAGSQANSGNAGNDTSCFPEQCFRMVLPDPAHPECDTPFKP